MHHLKGLNPQQREAAVHTDGPLLVVAGAGTGKTRTITHRIANLIATGVAPEKILAITFTNKAAAEMRERIHAMLGTEPLNRNGVPEQHRGPFIGTFHSLGVYILRNHGKAVSVPRHFSIYDRDDSLRAVKTAMQEAGISTDEYKPQIIRALISRAKGGGKHLEDYQDFAASGRDVHRAVAEVWERYDSLLKEERGVDFDDLLLLPLALLEENEVARSHYQDKWSHIHIDEYQDTNTVQYKLSKVLAGRHRNICIVGDLDQSIYGWRQAKPRNILTFKREFPESAEVPLAENYRSTPIILEAANRVIEKNTLRKDEKLYTSKQGGEKIGIALCGDERAEAEFVVEEAFNLIRSGVSASEIAVLFRTNFQSRALEEAFLHMNVPYQVVGTRFFERREVKDVLAYLSAALNRDAISHIKRIANTPRRGIGKVTLMYMVTNRIDELSPRAGDNVRSFYRILDSIADFADEHSVSEVVAHAAQTSGINAMLKDEGEDGEERLFNVRELAALAKRYDHLEPQEGLLKFLEDAALAADQDAIKSSEESVKLMTVHAAKGLEFDHIFITGLEDGLFPIRRDDMTKDDEEEERRLFYVALTRARKRAIITYATIRTVFGNTQSTMPSEFIGDIGEDIMEVLGEETGNNGWSGTELLTID